MKILILIKARGGGHERVMNSIKPLLEQKGHQVEIISREDDLNCFSTKQAFFKLRKEIKKRDYDILYTQDWSCALPFLFKKNHFCCHHGLTPSKIGRFLQKIVGKLMKEKTISVGPKVKEMFPKSTLIYNGVDLNKFYNMENERKYFGWIKRDYEEKDEKEINDIARSYGLELSIADKIPPEKMNKWYNSLKVFASYPRKFAGFNMCWIEAKASGVPEILGNENGIGIKNVKEKFNEFTWENNVNKFLEVIK